jgi:O-antigen ligase
MLGDLLLALGLVLENATQLHLPGTSLGVGELILIGWVAITLAGWAQRLVPEWSPALSRLVVFWLVFAFAQSIGLLVSLATEDFRDSSSAIRTAIAYVLMATTSILVLITPNRWQRLRRTIWLAVAFGGASVTILMADAFGVVPVPGIEPWVWSRFCGWSENPNQFAFLCTALVLLALHLAETAQSPLEILTALACGVVAFVGGVLTKSDSFLLFALIALPFVVVLRLCVWLLSTDPRFRHRAAFAVLFFLAVPSLLVSAAPFGPALLQRAQTFASATMEQNNQAENRFALWREALDIGLDAHMLGLGPGPHLVDKQWKRPPPDKFEAHNTLLDLFTQGGLVALVAFLWITVIAFVGALRAGYVALSGLVLSVFIFSNFHFNGRQLLLWFTIAVCLAAADAAMKADAPHSRPARRPIRSLEERGPT